MSFSRNKKDNGAEAFVTIEIRRFRSRYLFSNLKIEQKNRILSKEIIAFKSEQTARLNQSKRQESMKPERR